MSECPWSHRSSREEMSRLVRTKRRKCRDAMVVQQEVFGASGGGGGRVQMGVGGGAWAWGLARGQENRRMVGWTRRWSEWIGTTEGGASIHESIDR